MSNGDPRRYINNNNTRGSSNTYDGRPAPQDALLWLDFLRTAGGTVPADSPAPAPLLMNRGDSSDRKRRHTGSEPEGRSYPYPTHSASSAQLRFAESSGSNQGFGSSRETAIDLTSPPRRPPRPSFNHTMQTSSNERLSTPARRGEGEGAIPTWQPDAEVTKCPVCQAEFSFWYRKHHCRKCGRVVCANCSPHRITIPRQYIVQPPNPYEDEANPGSPGGLRGDPALGGGDTVRVCNPCVPDPWTPPPASSSQPNDPGRSQMRPPPRFVPLPNDPRLTATRDPSTGESLLTQAFAPYRPSHGVSLLQADLQRRNRPPGRSRASTLDNQVPTTGFNRPMASRIPEAERFAGGPQYRAQRPAGNPDYTARRYGYSHSQSHAGDALGTSAPQRWPGLQEDSQPMPAPAPVVPPRRREVREEDECPVCGVELPPGEALREIHVRQCIDTRFSSNQTQAPRAASPDDEYPESPPGASSRMSPVMPEASRRRASSYRPRGMALYRATEKDCTTEDGEPQECVICFEEFETGDEMGRMECLCKFHRHCIRQWWETKGQGSCPTHQLHED